MIGKFFSSYLINSVKTVSLLVKLLEDFFNKCSPEIHARNVTTAQESCRAATLGSSQSTEVLSDSMLFLFQCYS